jgi:hypothetical protein
VAAKRIEEFQKVNVADAHPATEDEAESAGDRDETYKPTTIKSLIEATDLPPGPPIPASEAAPMPAPKLAVLPTNTKPVQTIVASSDPAPAEAKPAAVALATTPPAGSWGIQIGAFGNEEKATAQATAAADTLRSEFSAAVPLVEPATIKGAKLYRAQIHGLAKGDLLKACSMVKLQPKTTCKALAPEGTLAKG